MTGGRRSGRVVVGWAVIAMLGLAGAALAEGESSEKRHPNDTGRFYLYFQTGHAEIVDKDVGGDAFFDTPDGINVVLGGGGGYNISEHWGIELQAHGTEPDVRSDRYGKFKEFSNITIIPAVRFRWPVGDGRLVPYLTAGIGGSLNEINDTSNPRLRLRTDKSSIVGALAAGLEYFFADDVAVGISLHSWIHPDLDTTFTRRDAANVVHHIDQSTLNLTSVAGLFHVRIFPGQGGGPGERRLLLADHGPFDTDAIRGYAYLMGGHTFQFDEDFGGGVTAEAPGDFNATLGGGLGVNLSRHWGFEVQLVNTEPNLEFTAIGKFAEVSIFGVLPAVRFRWQFLGGRLVPFATAGVGVVYGHVNDARQQVDQFGVGTVRAPAASMDEGAIIAGTVGVGVEYFLNRNLSVGFALPAYLYGDVDTRVHYGTSRQGGPGGGLAGRGTVTSSANFSGMAALLQFKAYLP